MKCLLVCACGRVEVFLKQGRNVCLAWPLIRFRVIMGVDGEEGEMRKSSQASRVGLGCASCRSACHCRSGGALPRVVWSGGEVAQHREGRRDHAHRDRRKGFFFRTLAVMLRQTNIRPLKAHLPRPPRRRTCLSGSLVIREGAL